MTTTTSAPEVCPLDSNVGYWYGNGKYQVIADTLNNLVPDSGPVLMPKSPKLERFREASNVYYDLYNNNLCNRKGEFAKVFGFGARGYYQGWRQDYANELFTRLEEAMDEIILAAAVEQLLLRKGTV